MIYSQVKVGALKFAYLFIFFLIFLVGCGPADTITVSPTPSLPLPDAYPVPTAILPSEAYPPPDPTAHPGTLLAMDKPISVGDTVISGVGPAGLTIVIVNVTFLGEMLGTGTIGNDGTFAIEVSPIPAGIRVGLTADAESVGLTASDIKPGDDAINVPEVGYFYDSFVILQQ